MQSQFIQTIDSLRGESTVLFNQIDTLREDSRETKKEYFDNMLVYHQYTTQLLAQYSIKVDHLADTIVSKETLPSLTIEGIPTIETSNGEQILTYTLRSLNSNAHILDYYYVLINANFQESNRFHIDTPRIFMGGSMNFTSIVIPNEPRVLSIFLDRELEFKSDCFIAMEFLYKSK